MLVGKTIYFIIKEKEEEKEEEGGEGRGKERNNLKTPKP